MKHYPVVIVGAGPAGAACAKALSTAGISSLVLEKRSLPRHKTCSGVVYGQCQELLQKYFGKLPPADVRCNPEFVDADNVVECLPDGSTIPYVWELPKNGHEFSRRWINVWRNKYDHWLIKESGAEVADQARLVGFDPDDNGRVRVTVSMNGSLEEISCDYLVSAEGSSSLIRRTLDGDNIKNSPAAMTSYAYYEYADTGKLRDDTWYVFLWPEFGDIISCAHHKDDVLALSVGGMKGANLLPLEEKFVAHLVGAFGVDIGERRMAVGCVNHLAPPFLGSGRVLLAGDAAGLIYLNGEGMSSAIDSGYRAGLAIREALDNGAQGCAEAYTDSCADILSHMEYCLENGKFVVPQ